MGTLVGSRLKNTFILIVSNIWRARYTDNATVLDHFAFLVPQFRLQLDKINI